MFRPDLGITVYSDAGFERPWQLATYRIHTCFNWISESSTTNRESTLRQRFCVCWNVMQPWDLRTITYYLLSVTWYRHHCNYYSPFPCFLASSRPLGSGWMLEVGGLPLLLAPCPHSEASHNQLGKHHLSQALESLHVNLNEIQEPLMPLEFKLCVKLKC